MSTPAQSSIQQQQQQQRGRRTTRASPARSPEVSQSPARRASRSPSARFHAAANVPAITVRAASPSPFPALTRARNLSSYTVAELPQPAQGTPGSIIQALAKTHSTNRPAPICGTCAGILGDQLDTVGAQSTRMLTPALACAACNRPVQNGFEVKPVGAGYKATTILR